MKKLAEFKIIAILFGCSLAFVVGGCLWAYFILKRISQPLIIHSNDLVGIDRVGTAIDLLAAGFLGLVLVLVNFFIALELEERGLFWGKLLGAATLFLGILIFIGFAAIINVN